LHNKQSITAYTLASVIVQQSKDCIYTPSSEHQEDYLLLTNGTLSICDACRRHTAGIRYKTYS